MGISPYLSALRALVGHTMLQIPFVTALILNDERHVFLAQHARDGLWGTIGGALDPEENPKAGLKREVSEETGLDIVVHEVLNVHCGPHTTTQYASGDIANALAVVYRCTLVSAAQLPHLQADEIAKVAWFCAGDTSALPLKPWMNAVLDDYTALIRSKERDS